METNGGQVCTALVKDSRRTQLGGEAKKGQCLAYAQTVKWVPRASTDRVMLL